MADTKNVLVGLGAAASATLILHLWSRRNPEPPLPPSPKSYPLLGNALSMPPSNQHLGFMDLGKELNTNIFSLSMLGMVIIVLNSVDDAINLLEKRSNIYSDRVIPPMLGDPTLMDFGRATSLLPYDERWRKHRRLIHPWLHREAATAFQDLQQHEARKLLQRLAGIAERLEDSETLYSELFFTLSNTIMRSVYGYKLESIEDSLLTDLQKAIEHGSQAGMPANFLVNVFPFLKHVPEWLPGAGWKKVVNEWRKQQLDAVDDSYNWTKSRITAGDHEASQSIVASMINHGSKLGLSSEEIDDYVSNIAMTLFAGGTETSANILLVFALAMTLHPEVQAKAQEEIDTVIGRERLPTVEDRLQLPYVSRLINELKRWCPIFPTGLPHACVQGDTYRGYKIPKGAMVMANIWAMSRDERHYKDPESFDPDRFLDPSVPNCPVFGFGRRLCPGLHYAEASIFIAVASMLATFSFSMAKDASGKELPPKLDSENVLIYHPKPFKLHLQLRSTHHAELVKAGVE